MFTVGNTKCKSKLYILDESSKVFYSPHSESNLDFGYKTLADL